VNIFLDFQNLIFFTLYPFQKIEISRQPAKEKQTVSKSNENLKDRKNLKPNEKQTYLLLMSRPSIMFSAGGIQFRPTT
jgi:hypothetical protein